MLKNLIILTFITYIINEFVLDTPIQNFAETVLISILASFVASYLFCAYQNYFNFFCKRTECLRNFIWTIESNLKILKKIKQNEVEQRQYMPLFRHPQIFMERKMFFIDDGISNEILAYDNALNNFLLEDFSTNNVNTLICISNNLKNQTENNLKSIEFGLNKHPKAVLFLYIFIPQWLKYIYKHFWREKIAEMNTKA